MVCIAAFLIFAILGLFSARYRHLARKAWGCVLKRVTFKPCDINFQEEVKSRLLGKLILRAPRVARFVDRWSGVLSFLFVAVSLWSLVLVVNSGLNLLVYDTCDRNDVESCALAGEACGITSGSPGLWAAVREGQMVAWVADAVGGFAETASRIPDRLKTWDPGQYVSSANTYYRPYDPRKPTALEIIDPGCRFCAKLFRTIKETGFADRYNLTYLVYPIPDRKNANGYRFAHSVLIASYLEAVKQYPIRAEVPGDWQILERLFAGRDAGNVPYQVQFNTMYTAQEAEGALLAWLTEIGYTDAERAQVQATSRSAAVRASLSRQQEIVERRIRTVKIPTIMFDGRRYDRAVGPDTLQGPQ